MASNFLSGLYSPLGRFVRLLVKEIPISNLLIFFDLVADRGHHSIPLAPIDNRV